MSVDTLLSVSPSSLQQKSHSQQISKHQINRGMQSADMENSNNKLQGSQPLYIKINDDNEQLKAEKQKLKYQLTKGANLRRLKDPPVQTIELGSPLNTQLNKSSGHLKNKKKSILEEKEEAMKREISLLLESIDNKDEANDLSVSIDDSSIQQKHQEQIENKDMQIPENLFSLLNSQNDLKRLLTTLDENQLQAFDQIIRGWILNEYQSKLDQQGLMTLQTPDQDFLKHISTLHSDLVRMASPNVNIDLNQIYGGGRKDSYQQNYNEQQKRDFPMLIQSSSYKSTIEQSSLHNYD